MFEPRRQTTFTFEDYLERHQEWGYSTFGSPADGRDEQGPLDHLRKEIKEIEQHPKDLEEWVDAIILSIDGYLRAGGCVQTLLPDLFKKQTKNFSRDWPDWRKMPKGKAIEHVRTEAEVEAKRPLSLGDVIKQSRSK